MTATARPSVSPASPAVRWPRPTLLLVVTAWFLVMTLLLLWGLPSSATDALLFGADLPWPASRYAAEPALAELQESERGADVDRNPLDATGRIVNLTATEAQRAEILLRYRLYTRQPDEHITFRALSAMSPDALDFDPQLYQYGGGWIYLVGAALAGADQLRLVSLDAGLGAFLETPELFARYYVIARLVTLAFGALLLVAVFQLGRLSLGRSAGWLALTLLALSPVFISGVLEAKPHVPTACLLAWATVAAWHFLDHDQPLHVVILGLCVGYAAALTPLGGIGFVLLGLVAYYALRGPTPPRRRLRLRWLGLSAGLALAVYAITNPYVIAHLVTGSGALTSNITNTTEMYSISRFGRGMIRILEIAITAAGPLPLLLALLGVGASITRMGKLVAIVAVPALLLTLGLSLVAASKPAEFARFLVFPAAIVALGAAVFIRYLWRKNAWLGGVLLLLTILTTPTHAYLRSFLLDAGVTTEARYRAGAWLTARVPMTTPIAVIQEPAPYAIPPLDFADRTVLLLPTDRPLPDPLPQWLVVTADTADAIPDTPWRDRYAIVQTFGTDGPPSPITWANKPVFILELKSAGAAAAP